LRVIQPRYIGNDVAGFLFTDDRDTVVGFLTGVRDVIAGGFYLISRKILNSEFFLQQAQDNSV
jgi:hypothetical protein